MGCVVHKTTQKIHHHMSIDVGVGFVQTIFEDNISSRKSVEIDLSHVMTSQKNFLLSKNEIRMAEKKFLNACKNFLNICFCLHCLNMDL